MEAALRILGCLSHRDIRPLMQIEIRKGKPRVKSQHNSGPKFEALLEDS